MDLNNLIAECTAYDFKVMLEEKKPKSWLNNMESSWDQVGTKLGPSWDEIEKLFTALQDPKSMGELKDFNMTRNPNAGEEEKLNHLIGNLSEEEKRLALELLQKVQ